MIFVLRILLLNKWLTTKVFYYKDFRILLLHVLNQNDIIKVLRIIIDPKETIIA